MKSIHYLGLFAISIGLISGCSSQSSGRYSQKHDSAPVRAPTPAELVEPTPQKLTPSRGGNKPYKVFGKHYTPMKKAEGYTDEGYASWYGRKFHGHLTSNGEVYDMFSMSAAHKTLPLPTHVKVTNLKNNKSVIVRVNDRGPFHGSRIIDLSYSAAYKLDMLKTGTTKVRIETITAPAQKTLTPTESVVKPNAVVNAPAPIMTSGPKDYSVKSPVFNAQYFIQVFATRSKDKAASTGLGLSLLLDVDKRIQTLQDIHKLQLGPFSSEAIANHILASVKEQGYESAYLLKVTK